MNSSISSSSNDSSSRPQVLLLLALLVLLLVGGLVFVELEIRRSPLEQKISAFRSSFLAAPAGVPVFGDSHVESAFKYPLTSGKQSLLQNFGWPGFSVEETQDLMRLYLDRNGPGPVILQAGPHLFAPYRLVDMEQGRPLLLSGGQRKQLKFLSPVHKPYLLSWLQEGLSAKLRAEPVSVSGSQDDSHMTVDPVEAMIRAQQHEPLSGPARDKALKGYRAFLQDISARDVRVCLVSFPVHSAYRQIAGTRPGFTQVLDFIKEVARHDGLRYIDARAWLDDRDFIDPDHMSIAGSKTFLARLETACAVASNRKVSGEN